MLFRNTPVLVWRDTIRGGANRQGFDRWRHGDFGCQEFSLSGGATHEFHTSRFKVINTTSVSRIDPKKAKTSGRNPGNFKSTKGIQRKTFLTHMVNLREKNPC